MPHPSQTPIQHQSPVKTSPAQRNAVALKTFFRISELWNLTNADQQVLLGGIPKSTFHLWKRKQAGLLQNDTLERISYIVGIYRALQVLLPDTNAADNWVRKPNTAPLFNGTSALQRMLGGHASDLFVVRQYLDAQRGGWA